MNMPLILGETIRRTVLDHFYLLSKQLLNPLPGSHDHGLSIRSIRMHCTFAIAIVLFTGAYGWFGLHYEATGHMVTLSSLSTSPYIIVHQMMPRIIWPQIDFDLFIDFGMVFGTFVVLALSRQLDMRYGIVLDERIYQIKFGSMGKWLLFESFDF